MVANAFRYVLRLFAIYVLLWCALLDTILPFVSRVRIFRAIVSTYADAAQALGGTTKLNREE